MRDPERIDRILKKLSLRWKLTQDWRLGQLIFNICRELDAGDGFHLEDDIIEKYLDDRVWLQDPPYGKSLEAYQKEVEECRKELDQLKEDMSTIQIVLSKIFYDIKKVVKEAEENL